MNLTIPPFGVWRLYRDRTDSENRIAELKRDFELPSFCLDRFWNTEGILRHIVGLKPYERIPASLITSHQVHETVDHAGTPEIAIERPLKDKHLRATRNSASVNHLGYHPHGLRIKGGTDARQSRVRFNSWRERKHQGK